MEAPFVSVVVPTSRRATLLGDCLRSLAAQDYPAERFEIVVVENGAPDGTGGVVARLAAGKPHPTIRHLTRTRADANAARNAGLAVARGDPIFMVDDDTTAPPGWLRALVSGAERHPSAGCVGGPVRPRFDGPPPPTCPRHDLAGAEFDAGDREEEVAEVWGGNMAIRRSALDAVGPFREGLRWHQEWEWQQRLLAGGGRIVYVPAAGLTHRVAREGIARLAWEFLQRGYVQGSLGRHVPLHRAAGAAAGHLAHGVRARCTRGVTEAARQLGLLAGGLRGQRR
jgi:glycosyltransferase involved in cell wall biosynthesis